MITLRDHLLSCLLFFLSIAISITTAVFGLLTYHHNQIHSPMKESLIALVVVELIDVLSIPFYFFNLTIKSGISLLSTFASLGSGLRLIHILIFSNFNAEIMNSIYTEIFLQFYVASLLFKGFALCFDFQFMGVDYSTRDDVESITSVTHDNKQDSLTYTAQLYDQFVTMKPSSATLIDNHNISLQKQPLDLNIKPSITSIGPITSLSLNSSTYQDMSFQKLPIISQSTSSLEIAHMTRTNSGNQNRKSYDTSFGTPTLDKFMKKKTDRNVNIERAAINRIPSALLPPHLKPQPTTHKTSSPAPVIGPLDFRVPPLNLPRSQSVIGPTSSHGKLGLPYSHSNMDSYDSRIMPDIPRAQSISAFQHPPTIDYSTIRKLSKGDWTRNPAPFQSSPTETQQLQSNSPTTSEKSAELPKDDLVYESESDGDKSLNSQEQAMRYLASARNSISEPHEFFQSAMDTTQSTIQLDNVGSPVAKTKSHSPKKSISFLKSHSQQNSMSSFTFGRSTSISAPGSPKRRTVNRSATRKLSIKNLSLSSIVFDDSPENDNDEDIPDFSYVHELQRSPSKHRKSMHSKHPSMSKINEMTPRKQNTGHEYGHDSTILANESNEEDNAVQSTPESNQSRNSVFPSEVIGQYDREKWTTMERLNMIKDDKIDVVV